MCKSGGGSNRCQYADMLANVRKKARYKYRNEYNREAEVVKAVNSWKDANPEIVAIHLPEKMPFQFTPKDRPVPKALMQMLTPSSRVPVKGSNEEDRLKSVSKLHEEFTEWKSRLDEGEARAVGAYTMVGFELINAKLRKKGFTTQIANDSPEEKERMEAMYNRRVRAMKSAFKKVNPKDEPRKLYRFFRVPAGISPKDYVDRYLQTGEGFSDPAFMSTTNDPEFIMAHMHDRNKGTRNKGYVVMEILTKQGQSLQPEPETQAGDVQSLENEVLLPPGTKLKVAGFNPIQRFEYGSDRKDLHGQYNSAYSNSQYMFENHGHHRKGDRLTFPMVQLIDEKLITEYEKKDSLQSK